MPRTEAASQRIRDQRREAILRAAVQVFARKGLAATKIADIAAAAGMSHGLVYHYFNSKEDVFRMVVERALAGSVQVVEDAENQPGTPWQRLTWYTSEVLSGLRDEPEYLMVVLQAFTSETVPPELREHAQREGMTSYERLTRLIAAGKAAGEVRAGQLPPAAGVVFFLAPAIGPTVGGLLIHVGGWPLIFLINVPFGLIGALGTLRLPVRFAGGADRGVRFDLLGILLLAGGMVLVIYDSTLGLQQGWGAPEVWPLLAAGGVLLALYVIWALVRQHSAVDLKLLRHRQTALSILLSLLTSIVMFAMLFLVPIYMEDLQGLTPLVAGLALLPQGLVTGVGTVLGVSLGLRWGVRRSALLGLLILTGCTALLLTLDISTPAWITALILSGRGLALGLTVQPWLLGMIGGLAGDAVHDGNMLFNVVERMGGSVGIALLATFFTVREQARVSAVLASLGLPSGEQGTSALAQLPAAMRAALTHAAVAGLHDTILLLVGLSAIGCGISLLLRNVRGAKNPSTRNATEKDATAVSIPARAPAGLAAE